MPKFDMGAAWDDSMVLLRSHSALTGTIAAVFLFLPTLAFSWFGPQPIEPSAGANAQQMMDAVGQMVRQMAPYQIAISVIGAIGGVGILRLWLSRTSTSVGDALGFAVRMIPTMVAIQILLGLALAIAAVLLVMPGRLAGGNAAGALLSLIGVCALAALAAYAWGRIAVISPVVADRTVYNPIAAILQSLALTKGNGWRIFLFMFLVTVVIFIIAAVLGGVLSLLAGAGEAGRLVSGVVEGGFAAISGLVTTAIAAATYRQLSVSGASETFT